MTTHDPSDRSTPHRRKSVLMSNPRYLKAAGALLGILVVLALVFPKMLSTSWGKNQLIAFINHRLPGTVEIEEVHLSWFGPQSASQIVIKDPKGDVVIRIKELTTDVSPLAFLSADSDLGNAQVIGFQANLVEDNKGLTNLHHALVHPGMPEPPIKEKTERIGRYSELSLYLPFKGHLVIQDGTIDLLSSGKETITLSHIEATLDCRSADGYAHLELSGESHREDLSGKFTVETTVNGLNPHGRLYFLPSNSGVPLPEGDGKVRLKVDIENAAVGVFDHLLTFGYPSWTGLLSDAIGPNLNLRLDMLLSQQGPSIELKSDSENFQADLVTHLKEGKFVLDHPGRLSLTVTPDLFHRLWTLQKSNAHAPMLALKEEVNIKLEIERLMVPTQLAQNDQAQPTLRFTLGLDKADFATDEAVGDFSLHDVVGTFERLEASKASLYDLSGVVDYQTQKGQLRLAGKILDGKDAASPSVGDMVISATHLPTSLLDYTLAKGTLLSDILGDDVDLQLKIAQGAAERKGELQIGSDVIAAPSIEFTLANDLRITKPFQVHFQVSPGLVRYLVGPSRDLILEDKTSVLVTVKDLSIPLDADEWMSAAAIDVEAGTAPFVVGGLGQSKEGRIRFSNVKLQANGKQLSEVRFALRSDIAPDGVTPLLSAAFGSVSTLEVEGSLALQTNSAPSLEELRLSLQSELVDARALIRTQRDGSLNLASPATLRYNLKPDVLLALGLIKPEVPHLLQRTPIEVKVDELSVRLQNGQPELFFTRGRASIGELLAVQDDKADAIAALRDLSLSWRYDSTKESAGAILRANTELGGNHGSLQATVDIVNWIQKGWQGLREAGVKIDLAGHQLPLALASALTGHTSLEAIAGEAVDISLQGQYGAIGDLAPGALSLTVAGEQLHADASFLLSSQTVFAQAAKPLSLAWTVTPERWKALQQLLGWLGTKAELPWDVDQPSSLNANFSTFTLPWSTSREELFDAAAFAGALSWNDLKTKDRITGDEVAFETLSLSFKTPNIAKELDFQLDAKERSDLASDAIPTEISLQGRLNSLYTELGWIDPSRLSIDVALKGQELPLASLLRYPLQRAAISSQLTGLIGQRVNGTAQCQMQGSDGHIQASLTGGSGQFNVDAQIIKGVLTLNTPLALKLKITPQLQQGLLVDIAPYLAAVKSTDKPISFIVEPAGFSFPLDTANIRAARIGQAVIDLGKVEVDKESQLAVVISVLKGDAGNNSDSLNVWFTPLQLSLNDGVLKFARMDALIANRYPVALWGKIDLIKDRVRMIIGITAKALKEAYGLSRLDDKYVLQLPLTGTMDHATIDKGKATARVTALVAQTQGSPEGVMIGGVLDLLGGGLQDEKVPPPNGPLPWGDLPSHGSSRQSVADEKPLIDHLHKDLHKDLKKSAKKLLNAIGIPGN